MVISYLISFVNLFFTVLDWLIIIRILLSWFPNIDPYNPLVMLLRQITDPILEPARRIIPPLGMIDFSPIVVLLVLDLIIRPFIIRFLYMLY